MKTMLEMTRMSDEEVKRELDDAEMRMKCLNSDVEKSKNRAREDCVFAKNDNCVALNRAYCKVTECSFCKQRREMQKSA